MSQKIILSPYKVTPLVYESILKMPDDNIQDLVVSVFSPLKSRRKCYKLTSLDFQPHATEYFIDDFFQIINIAGTKKFSFEDSSSNIKLFKGLAALSQALGHTHIDYDFIVDRITAATDTKPSEGQFSEIIPELLYTYTSQVKQRTLVFKLEYFFGTEVITVLLANGCQTNTGRQRQDLEMAKQQAIRQLAERRKQREEV